MPDRLATLVSSAVGPAPWFWQTFPSVRGASGKTYEWRYGGDQCELAYLVTLHLPDEPSRPRLALNTYCRPFTLGDGLFGVWCPEGRNLRFVAFDPDSLKSFDFIEIVGWFKNSAERIYALTPPVNEFEVPLTTAPGTQPLEVPAEFRSLDELLVPTSYKAMANTDPAVAIFVLYLQAGLIEVLPQNWITTATHDIANNWITRATRDPQSHRIVGEMSKVGSFELQANGRDFQRWL
jgi:hypothetical protein